MKIKLENMDCECSVKEFIELKENIDFKNMIKKTFSEIGKKCLESIESKREKVISKKVPEKKVETSRKKRSKENNSKKYDKAIKLLKKGGISKANALRRSGLAANGSCYTTLGKKLKLAK